MPFVRIDLMQGRRSAEERAAIGDAVYEAMLETIDIPPGDRFQVITEHDAAGFRYEADFLGIHRDDDLVFIHFTMKTGRTPDQKRALYRRIAELFEERFGIRPANVFVAIADNQLADWSLGNGVATLIDEPIPEEFSRRLPDSA
jgi:phenylpyruvate tautomerase PptA (4-oxalocrotonate tautomerase family)